MDNLRRTWRTEDGYIAVIKEYEPNNSLDPWFTAYIGVPENHLATKLAEQDVPLDVHGGLTYGPAECLPSFDQKGDKDVIWFGWDYNHAFDTERDVEMKEVVEEAKSAIKQFRDMTAKEIVKKKLRFLPGAVLDRVKVEEV